jgi:molybdopterin molybdotransferase
MPELLTVIPPAVALNHWLANLTFTPAVETISTAQALGRVVAQSLKSPIALPAFPRSTMDGYAVRAADTYGATESLPAYLAVIGETPMGRAPDFTLGRGQAALAHTGGMLPPGADAVVMVERTQKMDAANIEVLRAVAIGENVVQVGEDVEQDAELFNAGHILRPQDIGGLMALGITQVAAARQPRVAILSSGDEVVPPEQTPGPGQVRDVNTYTVAGLVTRAGGLALPQGITGDDFATLQAAAQRAFELADALVFSAGSSVSVRDMTADVISTLGQPGVLIHGLSVKPGKPTVIAVCNGKPVLGLPGNPVSAMVIADLLLTPLLWRWQGVPNPPQPCVVQARLMRNVPSVTGREDYIQVKLVERAGELWADPVFGKSALIYTLVKADGLLKIPLDIGGLQAGEWAEVRLF